MIRARWGSAPEWLLALAPPARLRATNAPELYGVPLHNGP
jgi:hypothetical protein